MIAVQSDNQNASRYKPEPGVPGPQNPARSNSIRRMLLAFLFNAVLTLCLTFFAVAQGSAFIRYHRVSSLILLVKESLDVVFYLSKRRAWTVSHSGFDWFVTCLGTTWALMYRPTGVADDFLLASALQIGGALLQVVALLSLNRSFGLVPANRGVRTGGLYRFVRHPLYMSYIICQIGYVLNNMTLHNVNVFCTATFFQLLRISREEALLRRDEAYRNYMQQTPWRLCPGLF